MTIIKNATIVNEGVSFVGHVFIEDGVIQEILPATAEVEKDQADVIDATGLYLIPGVIDDQVHFREPGLTHKGNIRSESRAAAAGGITSFMEMPNTNPQTTTRIEWEKKMAIGERDAMVNYSFFFGGTNENIDEVLAVSPTDTPGIKFFMGSSTGNMLVDNREILEGVFSKSKLLIATHCEDEQTIRNNTAQFKEKYGEAVPMSAHPLIRSAEACYKSSSLAVEIAKKYDTRLHILHISTAKELSLFDHSRPLSEKRITAEACIHHLWFSDQDYLSKGAFIKWNPAVKTAEDRAAVFQGLLEDRIDIIATDHAPHALEEKQNTYFNAPSGGPLVQHALPAMLEFVHQGKITLERVVEKMCHAPAECFNLVRRGYIRKGYKADLVLIDLKQSWTVSKDNILYHCGWSPFEGTTFQSAIRKTFVNGRIVYEDGKLIEANSNAAEPLKFSR